MVQTIREKRPEPTAECLVLSSHYLFEIFELVIGQQLASRARGVIQDIDHADAARIPKRQAQRFNPVDVTIASSRDHHVRPYFPDGPE